jgi:hypothetical protein
MYYLEEIISKLCIDINSENPKSAGHCVKSMLLLNLTFTFSLCSCQREEKTESENWKLSYKKMVLLALHNKMSLTSPRTFHFHLIFCYAFFPCLPLSFSYCIVGTACSNGFQGLTLTKLFASPTTAALLLRSGESN